MAIKLVLLIGSEDAGKNTTLIQFCKFYGYTAKINKKGKDVFRRGKIILKGKISDKEVLILPMVSSPQEKEAFCHFEDVNKIISEFMESNKRTAKRYGFNDFLVIIAFTVRVQDGKVGDKCITEPIKELTSKGYEIFKVYLRRTDINYFKEINDFVENELKYGKLIISTNEGIKQGTELKNFIEEKVYGYSTKSQINGV